MFYLVLFCFCVFSPVSIGITSLGQERANLSVFPTFVRFALVWFCLFSLPLGVWEELWFVIVAFHFFFFFFFFFVFIIYNKEEAITLAVSLLTYKL